jgi:hypothetical protein
MKLELEREREAIAIEIVVGYLCKEVHGHQGCNAVPPELSKVGSFSVSQVDCDRCQVLGGVNFDIDKAAAILVAQYSLQLHVGHATPPGPPVDCAWWDAALKRREDKVRGASLNTTNDVLDCLLDCADCAGTS